MRIVTSKHFGDGLVTVTRDWSFADQLHAHKVLDCLDDCAEAARPDPPRER